MLNRSRPAQSLLEAIIAIGVILVATISATTLIIVTITAGRASTDKIEAANFAREGVEVVRQIRDSNWMKRAQNINNPSTGTTYAWDDNPFFLGLDSDFRVENAKYAQLGGAIGDQNTFSLSYSPTTGWSLNDGSSNPVNNIISKNQFSPSTTFFTQYCSDPTCTATKYSRTITIEKKTETNAGDYLDIVSTVTWRNRGDKFLKVSERLYDWR